MNEVISGGFALQGKQPWSRDYIRVVSWNVERGVRFSAILEFLRAAEADVVLLQEVDLKTRRSQYRDVPHELARSLQLNYAFGTEFLELRGGSGRLPALHGQATLSPWPLSNGRIIRFQSQSNFWKPRWYIPQIELFQRRLGGRIALVTEAMIYNQRLVTYNLHLESKGHDALRLQQLRETLKDAGRHTASSVVIVGGDLNLDAGNGAVSAALHGAGFHDAVRLPEIATTTRLPFQRARCIDWIYVSEGAVTDGQVHNTIRVSDHYPVSATLPKQSPADAHLMV
jgi:endonuclease/exonuclease/phosphatase family metal-dependent hydrolase